MPTSGGLAIRADGPDGSKVRVVTFIRAASTEVEGGENAGKTLPEAHIVTGSMVLGPPRAEPYAAAAPKAGAGCAVLVEAGVGGPILAAQYCNPTQTE